MARVVEVERIGEDGGLEHRGEQLVVRRAPHAHRGARGGVRTQRRAVCGAACDDRPLDFSARFQRGSRGRADPELRAEGHADPERVGSPATVARPRGGRAGVGGRGLEGGARAVPVPVVEAARALCRAYGEQERRAGRGRRAWAREHSVGVGRAARPPATTRRALLSACSLDACAAGRAGGACVAAADSTYLVRAAWSSRRLSHERSATRPWPWWTAKSVVDAPPAPPSPSLTARIAAIDSYASSPTSADRVAAAAAASASAPGAAEAMARSSSANGHASSATGIGTPDSVSSVPANAGLEAAFFPSPSVAAALWERSAVRSAARCSVEKEILVVDRPRNELLPSSLRTVIVKSPASMPPQVTSTRSVAYDHSFVTSNVVGLSVSADFSQMQKSRGYFPFQEFFVVRKRRMYVIPAVAECVHCQPATRVRGHNVGVEAPRLTVGATKWHGGLIGAVVVVMWALDGQHVRRVEPHGTADRGA